MSARPVIDRQAWRNAIRQRAPELQAVYGFPTQLAETMAAFETQQRPPEIPADSWNQFVEDLRNYLGSWHGVGSEYHPVKSSGPIKKGGA
ncbi:hypothetical protein [Magnetofaba australis]|uniref:Uncharacterized protein n=1 Tax=Magnetofaba australis IT-1 TaxID=1434232 RepID=A0A1Y2K7M8_9PROT|nr:hypothetical protein [Magnetofaba australis]OSM06760.1 hypothetical protein MAIT1_00383 [Magnetofaba australis IT-1]